MSILSTTAQAAGLTILVTLAFIAAGFALLTDVGRPVGPAPFAGAAEAGPKARGLAPDQAARPALEPTPITPTLPGSDATSSRLNTVTPSGEPAVWGERAVKIEGRNNPVATRGPESAGEESYPAQPGVSAPAGAGEDAPPAATVAASVAPAATGTGERPRPKTAGELTRPLSMMGHKVHATLSGDGASTTLSISGATLTRQDAVRWLGSAGARRELKSAGVRIVVLVSGSESWTFML